ncbi:MAG TPA: pantoate--beta-alanine ligase [Thiotrichales bacterium]|nr:pantoate--beta-alanine ligase [Thiotrichales bacterium]
MTQLIHQLAHWRDIRQQWQDSSQRIAFVPTMGNLHEGHFSLVKLAQQHADKVVVSIFVNPLQFGPNEDFDRYPRTLDADVQALRQLGVDVVFAPDMDEVYPDRSSDASGGEGFLVLPPPKLTNILCGESRPGHFTGVATIVLKLFNMIQPQLAVFGEKDYQQLAIIKAMVRALNLPIKIISAPTCRAADGLALSSRNQYLSTLERQQAPAIYQTLQTIGLGLHQGQSSEVLIEQAQQQLIRLGFNDIDYIAIRHPKSLEKLVQLGREGAVVLIAARLGNTRLIDNLLVFH